VTSRPILAVAENEGATLLLGNGDGSFRPTTHYRYGSSAQQIGLGDVNGDSRLDIVTAFFAGVGVLLGRGDGTFATPITTPMAGRATGPIGLVDVSGDGKIALIATPLGQNFVEILPGNGDGSFRAAVPIVFSEVRVVGGLTVADFNGDGKADILVPPRRVVG
jgi:large repetitive protein